MKKRATIYAIVNTLLFVSGCILVFYFAWRSGVPQVVSALVGLVFSFMLAPLAHELGHLIFAYVTQMEYVYFKAFCFRFVRKGGKGKFSFASPFTADETQVLPKQSGSMQKRAAWYAIGGLFLQGFMLFVFLGGAIICTALSHTRFSLWGSIPYFVYLFLLNVAPLEYDSGKTDMLVYRGIKKGAPAEKNMLAAMEIQGCLYEGKSFTEIPEAYFFDQPQLCEDEPLFAVMLDLRYRYYLEKNQLEKAADCLNRLTQTQAYLSESEVQKIAAELVYMHALRGDFERAEACGALCKEYLTEDTAAAKRILAAYSAAFGKKEAISPLKEQAKECLSKERIAGIRKFEGILLDRISEEENAQNSEENQ